MSQKIRASRRLAAALAVPLTIAAASSTGLATETPRLPKSLINLSSHSAEFLEDLLTGRVWVYRRNGAPAVAYFGADGAFHNCSLRRDETGYRFSGAGWEWRIGTRTNKTALQVTVHPGGRKHGMVVIYTPESGRFHAEQYFRKTGNWRIVHDGWVQDTLPAVMETYCHNLRGIPGLEIDRSQTELDWSEFRAPPGPSVITPDTSTAISAPPASRRRAARPRPAPLRAPGGSPRARSGCVSMGRPEATASSSPNTEKPVP